MLTNGSTAIDGFWRRARRAAASVAARAPRAAPVVEQDPEDPDRPGDVLDVLLAQILEGDVEPVADLVAHRRRDADAARLGQRLEPRGDIDAVAEDVAVLDDHVAEIDADAELDASAPAARRRLRRAIRCWISTAHVHGVGDALELDQHAVAGRS